MMRRVNLIPTERKERRRRRARMRAWAVACAAYAALMGVVCVGAQRVWGKHQDLGAELRDAENKGKESAAIVAELKKQVIEAEANRGVVLMLGEQPDWSILLALL